MSRELKDLIESIDSANRAHSDLEKIIRYLREEVQRLTFTINEQKEIIKEQRNKLNQIDDNHLPADINVLKDIISNQREEIIKKEKDIEILKQTLEDITNELETTQNFEEENQEIIYSNKVIVQLTEENEIKSREIKKLKDKIETIQNERKSISISNSEDKDQKLIDAKKIIFQLTEENGINRVKIESLKADLEEINSKLDEVKSTNISLSENIEGLKVEKNNLLFKNEELTNNIRELEKKLRTTNENFSIDQKHQFTQKIKEIEEENEKLIDALKSNIEITEDLKKRNEQLEGELNNLKNTDINKESEYRRELAQRDEELETLNIRLKKIENANKQLNESILKLKQQERSAIDNGKSIKAQEIIKLGTIPPSLFFTMFSSLEKESQTQIKNLLIRSLDHKIREKRINAIKLLSTIKSSEVLNSLKKLVGTNDWIIKLYLINALKKFEKKEVLEVLQQLAKDKDIDVKEAAEKALKNFL